MFKMIKMFMAKRQWHQFKKGEVQSIDSSEDIRFVLKMLPQELLVNPEYTALKEFYIHTSFGHLDGLLETLSNCRYCIRSEMESLPNPTTLPHEDAILLTDWLGLKHRGEYIQRLHRVGEELIEIYEKGSYLPETYVRRKVKVITESFLAMAEILGEISYGQTERE